MTYNRTIPTKLESTETAAQLPFTGAMFWLMWKRLSGS